MTEEVGILLEHNDRLLKLAEDKMQVDIQDGNHKTFFESFILGKAFKTFEATLLLCKNGYGEDGFMLARTLFELMVTNSYILQDGTGERLERYGKHEWVSRKNMYDYISSSPKLLEDFNKSLENSDNPNVIAEVEEEYKKVMAKYKYGKGWSDKSIKGMCEAIGRADMYSTVYSLQSDMSHGNARSVADYAEVTNEGSIFNIGSNWKMVGQTLVIAFDCFFHILKEADNLFKWNLDSTLEDLSNSYAEEVKKLNNVSF